MSNKARVGSAAHTHNAVEVQPAEQAQPWCCLRSRCLLPAMPPRDLPMPLLARPQVACRPLSVSMGNAIKSIKSCLEKMKLQPPPSEQQVGQGRFAPPHHGSHVLRV